MYKYEYILSTNSFQAFEKFKAFGQIRLLSFCLLSCYLQICILYVRNKKIVSALSAAQTFKMQIHKLTHTHILQIEYIEYLVVNPCRVLYMAKFMPFCYFVSFSHTYGRIPA